MNCTNGEEKDLDQYFDVVRKGSQKLGKYYLSNGS